jgi:ribonuclease D
MNATVMTSPVAPPVWVSRPDSFKKMIDDLARHWVIAVDTESNSLYAYREQVCLIQISTGEKDYLVDPLALSDLAPLGPIFASPDIEKVFHAAEYDLICLKRDYGFAFANLFDTMVASRDLGRPAVGLAAVLEQEFGVTLDKRFQRANWGARPLSAGMLAYARLDSYYLIPLRHRLKTDLEVNSRWALAEEDFLRMCATPAPSSEPDACNWWRVAAGSDVTAQQAAILAELCRYRDERARLADLPPFKVLSNQILVNIAQIAPQTPNEMMRASGLNGRQFERHVDGLLEAVKTGLQSSPLRRPLQPRPDDRFMNRLDRLKNWRKHTGLAWGVDSDVILPRDVMEELARAQTKLPQDLVEPMASVPWRCETFGKEIYNLLKY